MLEQQNVVDPGLEVLELVSLFHLTLTKKLMHQVVTFLTV